MSAAIATISPVVATLLYHPDLGRIGEQARIDGAASLSRTELAFAADGRPGRPLEFRGVSRTALGLFPSAGGWELRPSGPLAWSLDARTAAGAEHVADERLRDGVVVGLGAFVLVQLRMGHAPAPLRERLGLVGVSPELEALRRRIEQVSALPLPVLLRGETGTGKELVARALHAAGPRSARPFVAVNLGAVAGEAAVSQLFGHERGAFTGAEGRADGYFGMAEGGTLFLDEIGEADDRIQPMLLRALEAREIQPLGGRPRQVDVRLLFATDADLDRRVADGTFRRALLYRVAQAAIDLPPLRQRPADVPVQLVAFVRQLALAHGLDDPTGREGWLPVELVSALFVRTFPGNSRELRSLASRLVLECAGKRVADVVLPPAGNPVTSATSPSVPPPSPAPFVDERRVRAVLEESDYRLAVAAERLGIARNTLFSRMAEYGIKRPKDLGLDEIVAAWDQAGGDLAAAARALGISGRGLRLRRRELGLD